MTVDATGWHRLDPRMWLVNLRWLLPPLGILAVTALGAGGQVNWDDHRWSFLSAAFFVLLTGGEMVRYRTTHYRVTHDQVEVRSGLFWRRHVAIPRDRLRTVDVTAGPAHRIFGLSIVTVGTGQALKADRSDRLKLDAVSTSQAALLREELLPRLSSTAPTPTAPIRPTLTAPGSASASAVPEAGPAEVEALAGGVAEVRPIARLDLAWLRYAPLTPLVFVIGLAPLTQAYNLAQNLGIDVDLGGAVLGAVDFLSSIPGWLILLLVIVMLAAGVVGTGLLFVEAWWKFTLDREPGSGTIRVRRGLVTTRSFTLEERRLRGAELVEPLMLRWGRGARLKAIASGLRTTMEGPRGGAGALLPPAPRPMAHRVAASVLAERDSPLLPVRLRAHPRAALRRRLVRAAVVSGLVVASAGGVAALAGLSVGWSVLVAAVVVAPVSAALAVDAYRALGHALSGAYLVTRSGSLMRRTVALNRGGIIGWTLSRSPFQRRSGLATIAATTAAGTFGSYSMRDVDYGDGLAVADAAVPGLIAQFLEVEGSDPAKE
ncbi:PH domain-containing protein [Nonomuraea sp. NPDC000554]|uniref:PH domain-containing protein n=1 Tax=Nonomuraea sp. NPDC000554 TaxID=3154259 RepID=UPI00332CE625